MSKRLLTITGLEKNRPIYKIHITLEVEAATPIFDKVQSAGDIFLESLCKSLEICGVIKEEISISDRFLQRDEPERE